MTEDRTRSGWSWAFGTGQAEGNILALCERTGSLKMNTFPDAFQMGLPSWNCRSKHDDIAAGMTVGGKIFTGTANFSTGRVYDQIRQCIACSGKNAKNLCSHAGRPLEKMVHTRFWKHRQ